MKFPGGDSADVLDPLLLSSWTGASDHFLVEGGHKLEEDDDEDSKPDMDELDLLLTSNTNNNSSSEPNNNRLAELKPLPPFTGYTGHLSINGISGHHFHTIAAAPSPPRLDHQRSASNNSSSGSTTSSSDISEHTSTPTVYYATDHQVTSSTMPDVCLDGAIIKSEPDMGFGNPEIDDISKLIGLAIADTTVPSANDTSRDSWIDINSIESWFEGAIEGATPGATSSKTVIPSTNSGNNGSTTTTSNVDSAILSETLQEFVNLQFTVPQVNAQVYQQSLKQRDTSGYMPILQSRLTKPDTLAYMVAECTSPSSSTTAGSYLAHSPPSHVVSTSDLQVRYNPVHSSTRPSPELQVSFPHTTTPNKKSKSRNKNKTTAAATSTVVYAEGAMGKEKPVHRCNVCNRGFLNKSNIKVHLRTHTGEKPFRCDVCGKTFRQKAHLIKHAQIHKRIGRD